MTSFETGEENWIAGLGNLRNVIRQELITRQLNEHVQPGSSILDVGCGQGTQALRLVEQGHRVTGLDRSIALLDLCRTDAADRGLLIDLREGDLRDLDSMLFHPAPDSFDVVCAHGVLMYVEDRDDFVASLCRRVAPGGFLSLTFRNAHALAMRPGLRRQWSRAMKAFDADTYVNGLGVKARADRLEDIEATLSECGFETSQWYGVRVFNDGIPNSMTIEEADDLPALLDAEEQAGSRDPYRWMASQVHLVAQSC